MRHLRVGHLVRLIVGLSLVFWVALALVTGRAGNLREVWPLIKLLPSVVMLDVLAALVFVKWVWKWKWLQGWLVPFPDLGGTWEGDIRTTWENPETGARPEPIPAMLTIQQTFTSISCILRTAEMTSESYCSDFILEGSSPLKKLAYSYRSKPRPEVRDRSPLHEGTIVFEIVGTLPKRLKGEYWTSRQTVGEIELTFKGKQIREELPKRLKDHPLGNGRP